MLTCLQSIPVPTLRLFQWLFTYAVVRLKAQYSRPYKLISRRSHVAVVHSRRRLTERNCFLYVEYCQCYTHARFCQNPSSSSKAEIGENAYTLSNGVLVLISLIALLTEEIWFAVERFSLDICSCFVCSVESSCNKAVAQRKIFRTATRQAVCYTYNFTLMRVRVTIVAIEKQ